MVKIFKILYILLVIVSVLSFVNISNADSGSATSFSSIWSKGQGFISKGEGGEKITTDEAVTQLVPIGRILVGIASVVLVVAGLIIAVKYMMSGADERAKLKEKLLWYVISIVVVYGAVGIYNVVTKVMKQILV